MEREKINRTAQKMTDARALIVKDNPFFGHLAMELQLACGSCGTACTDGIRLIFDPDFAVRLSEREMQFVILHEVLHCVLEHCTRGKGLLPEIHNVACDIVVNSVIFHMWGVDDFKVDGEVPMHLTPDGREGRLFNAEEVYHMLLSDNPYAKEEKFSDRIFLDRHDLWQGIQNEASVRDRWKGHIGRAVKACGGSAELPPIVRNLAEKLLKRSEADWKQLLHDFLQYDAWDYTFLPPDRRFSEADFYLPAYNEDEETETAKDIWVCVDTSASVSDEELTEAMGEIRDAMRQAGLKGMISFFDNTITEPVPFATEEELHNITPAGGRGTSFHVIFRYLKEHLYPELPRAILIFTDGYASFPEEKEALEVPVLWLISKGGNKEIPWGKTAHF